MRGVRSNPGPVLLTRVDEATCGRHGGSQMPDVAVILTTDGCRVTAYVIGGTELEA